MKKIIKGFTISLGVVLLLTVFVETAEAAVKGIFEIKKEIEVIKEKKDDKEYSVEFDYNLIESSTKKYSNKLTVYKYTLEFRGNEYVVHILEVAEEVKEFEVYENKELVENENGKAMAYFVHYDQKKKDEKTKHI